MLRKLKKLCKIKCWAIKKCVKYSGLPKKEYLLPKNNNLHQLNIEQDVYPALTLLLVHNVHVNNKDLKILSCNCLVTSVLAP